jgi:hypothetical protein
MLVVVAFMIVTFVGSILRVLAGFRLGGVFDGVSGTQRFLPSMRCARPTNCKNGVETAAQGETRREVRRARAEHSLLSW